MDMGYVFTYFERNFVAYNEKSQKYVDYKDKILTEILSKSEETIKQLKSYAKMEFNDLDEQDALTIGMTLKSISELFESAEALISQKWYVSLRNEIPDIYYPRLLALNNEHHEHANDIINNYANVLGFIRCLTDYGYQSEHVEKILRKIASRLVIKLVNLDTMNVQANYNLREYSKYRRDK